MHLVIDIGNTNIVCGLFSKAKGAYKLLHNFRLSTPSNMTTDELAVNFKNMLIHNNIKSSQIDKTIFASVVPSVNHNITKMMTLYFDREAIPVTWSVIQDMKVSYDHPDDLGIDRLINCKATVTLYGKPAIIVDFGTAIKIDIINNQNTYLGGLIMPGIAISLNSLVQATSKLPKIELKLPQKIIGNTTREGMQNGIYYLNRFGVETIVQEIIKEHFHGQEVQVVATGGLSHFIAQSSQVIRLIEPDLTLIGLKVILDEILYK